MKKQIITILLVFSMLFGLCGVALADGGSAPTQQAVKHLHKSQTNRVFGGVCGGIAEYYGFDPTAVRAGFIVGSIFGGATEVLYVVLWIIMPDN